MVKDYQKVFYVWVSMKPAFFIYFFLISIFFNYKLKAIDIGSDTQVTRFNNQVILAEGDRIAGAAALDAGFAFFDPTVTATFDSFFAVQGDIAINGGNLYLNKDLIFSSVSSFQTLGNIIGNNHMMSLSPSMNCIPDTPDDPINCSLLRVDDDTAAGLVLTSDWTFNSDYVAMGVFSTSSIEVFRVNNNILTNVTSEPLAAGSLPDLIRWNPVSLLLAVARFAVAGIEPEILIYSFDTTGNTLTLESSLNPGVSYFGVAWHPNGRYLAAITSAATATIELYSVDDNGIINPVALDTLAVPSGTASFTTRHAFEFDKTGEFLVVGVNNTAGSPDLYVLEFDEITETFSINASLDVTGEVTTLAATWNPGDSNFIAASFLTPASVSIIEHDPNAGTLTTLTSTPQAVFVVTLEWSPNGLCLAFGRNTNLEVFSFNPVTLTLSSTFFEALATRVDTVRWAPNGANVFQSTLFTPTPALYSSQAGTIIDPVTTCVEFSDLNLFLNCNVELKDCCITFTGNSVINGQGNCLSLRPTCSIIVDTNSSLLIKNIKIKGVNERRLVGTDSTSTFSFKNTELVLDNDFTFDTGRFDILSDLTITGNTHTFNYETDQISTVSSCARLKLNYGLTLKYNPPIAANNLLQFTDNTAELFLCSAKIDIVDELELTKGLLFIDGCSSLSATGFPAEISFGDGVNVNNNLCVRISPAAKLELTNGTLVHKNI